MTENDAFNTHNTNKVGIYLDSSREDREIYDVNTNNYGSDEFSLYPEYNGLFYENNYAQLLFLDLFYHIKGVSIYEGRGTNADKDEQIVKQYIKENDLDWHFDQILLQSVVLGNGFMFYNKTSGEAKRIDANIVMIERDTDGVYEYTITQSDSETDLPTGAETNIIKYTKNNIQQFTLIDWPETPYGISHARGSVHDFKAMKGMTRDAYAAVKNISARNRIFSLHLEGLEDDEVTVAFATAKAMFEDFNSSTTSIIAIDDRNKLFEMGTSSGASGKAIEPFAPIVETPLGVMTGRFAVSLGYLLPTHANKSIMQETEKHNRYKLNSDREKWAWYKEQFLNKMLGDKIGYITVSIKDPVTEPNKDKEFALAEAQAGLISQEEYRRMYRPELPTIPEKEDTFLTVSGVQTVNTNIGEGDNHEDGDPRSG